MATEYKCTPVSTKCGLPDSESKYKPPYLGKLVSESLISSDGSSELMSSDVTSELITATYI